VIEGAVEADRADTGPAIDISTVREGEPTEGQPDADTSPEDLPRESSGRSIAAGRGVSFAFNLAKIEGQGEDCDPILREGRELGLAAVFDGMGGSGGTVYETADGPRTGAYLASRVARDVVEHRMLDLLDPEWDLDGPDTARDLQQTVKSALAGRLAELNAPASGLRSRLLRALPTTMALAAMQRREHGGDLWDCHLFWAGDSRAYVFEPASGAHQLTVDDIRGSGDAMANLREDSVVSNAMSADTDFVVHHHQVQLSAPFLVVAATDGSFGYVPTPMHFEYLVLAALRDSDDPESWSSMMQASIGEVTGDDASMALLGVGAEHARFKELFADRTAQLESGCITPLNQLEVEVMGAERRLQELSRHQQQQRAVLWTDYKPGYEHYLTAARDRS
jgi:hypothetical protein